MAFLFWLFWIIDLLAALFLFWSIGFRRGFGAGTELNSVVLTGVVIVLAGSLVLRYGFKLPVWSLWVAALPLLAGFGAYLIDSGKK